MAQNCNRIIPFDEDTLQQKSALGLSVSVALHAALSNCYKAIEVLETSRAASGAEAVYLRAATVKLETAAQALRGMRDILAKGRLSEAAVAWLKALDYDRLYMVGTKKGLIPAVSEEWNRLVELIGSLDHLSVTNCLIADVEKLRRDVSVMINDLASGTSGAPLSVKQVERLATIQTALVQLAVFAQMVSYVNAIEPMDATWCRGVDVADSGRGDNEVGSFIQ
jgi:hypothetical protein